MSEKIKIIERGINVHAIYWALLQHPHLWNQHTARTEHPDSPHHGLDDIWVRFGAEQHAKDQAAHFPGWYESADVLGLKPFLRNLMHAVGGDILGGVLITRIPAGATCKPHTDMGWHALQYEKYAVQITSAPGQKFCFEDEEVETAPGDLFWFENQSKHWVLNPTNYERITMIACIK
jgi:quercetin dioxygenase-like cupin family protein